MFKLFKTAASKESYSKKEKRISHFLPYKCHWNHDTILTTNNSLLQIIKVGGFSFETADDIDLEIRKNIRNSLFKNMASGNVTLYFYTIRTRNPQEYTTEYSRTIDSQLSFTEYVELLWSQKSKNTDAYFNELYVAVLYQPDQQGAAIIQYLLEKISHKSNRASWEAYMKSMSQELFEITNHIMTSLDSYDAKLLSIQKNNYGLFCEISEFLARLVNCGYTSPIALSTGDISEYLPMSRLFFGSRAIEAQTPKGNRYAGIVTAREYSPHTSTGVFDNFLQMPFEFIMTQSFSFSNRTVAINKMQLQQNRMIQAEDKAVSQIAEISEALDMAMSGEIGFGEHHMSILCIEDNIKSLEGAVSMASVELANIGMQAVRERINMEPSYWGQLPGNRNYVVRKATVNTLNLAGFASLHNYPPGQKADNHWGEYVTILDTTSGTPFYFNFHVKDVGHTLIIGPTGAGKTVLMNFLCAQAQKFSPRMFFFDKDRGAEIFIRAIDGVYSIIDPGKNCGFNPLQLKDTGENRIFILEWLKVLVTINGETLDAEEIKLLTQTIDGNFKLNKKDRKLSNVIPFLGMNSPGSLASRISMWHGKGSHARIFDNDEDSIDLDQARVFGFEMAQLLKDSFALSPVLLYIFHRINIALDGSPTMIVLDEAWALIDNPVFAPKIKDWLKVLRKLNTFVIFATQSVEDASKSQISDTLIQQTATQIFLPNLKATEVYRTAFLLSEREFNLIRTTDPSSRYFILKQGINAVVARLNLYGMDDIINVLSGSAETVLLLDKIIAEYGDDPTKWLPVFYEETKK